MTKKRTFYFIVLWCSVLADGGFAVEKPVTEQKTCITDQCHVDYAKKAFVHGPVDLVDCQSCHEPVEAAEHSWQFVREGSDLCEYCHLDQKSKKNVHEPLKTGGCTQCHDPHSSNNKFLLLQDRVGDLCNECHDIGHSDKYLHGPAAVGECTICHESHSSDHEKLLRDKSSNLCFSCHTTTKKELDSFEFVHTPVKDNCISCHDAHGADNSKMLKTEAPEMCYNCHKDIKKTAETSKYKHSIVTNKGGCLKCHTPHASTIKNGLRDVPAKLCKSCHDKPVGLNKDEVLRAFTDEVKDKKFLHGPVAQDDCGGCHSTHGSEHFRLLSKKYPSMFYSPFKKENYELCFSCHQDTLVLTETTTGLTNFRNGNRNLHFLHVNKSNRGRTCRSCHETHASNLPNHIRESVPYGAWNLPILFTKNETGGSCKPGCHLPFAYDRKNPVDYKTKSEVK